MGVGAGLYMYVVIVKSSRSLSHLLMSSCCIDVGSVRSGLMICNRIISEHAEGLISQTDTYRTYDGVLY